MRLAQTSLLATAALCGTAFAQTTASVTVDATSWGCQAGGAVLTGGVVASADLDVTYDSATGALQLTVTNTSPVVTGESTPLLTQIYLNLPQGAIDSASLVGQTGSGGATPGFSLSFDADTLAAPNPNGVNCFGDFNLCLSNGGSVHGGISNPSATSISAPPGSWVEGPVTFDLQLGGPGAGGINAAAILASFSNNGAQRDVPVALKFMAGGVGGEESGVLGSGEECPTAVYFIGEPCIGNTIDICATGGNGCHACIWVSVFPGPVTIGNITIPIGLPTIAQFDFGDFVGTHQLCTTVNIPNAANLVGLTLYWTNLTHPFGNPAGFSFSPASQFTVCD